MDREASPAVTVMVFARDSGEPSRTASTLVQISLTDINDNKPKFTHPQYLLSYREGFMGAVDLPAVTDADLPPNDEYEIIISADLDYFTPGDGVINLNRPLDVPAGLEYKDYLIGKRLAHLPRFPFMLETGIKIAFYADLLHSVNLVLLYTIAVAIAVGKSSQRAIYNQPLKLSK